VNSQYCPRRPRFRSPKSGLPPRRTVPFRHSAKVQLVCNILLTLRSGHIPSQFLRGVKDVLHRGLKSGDLVEVRSAGEILATLDDTGALEALPFMPEMLPYLGRRFVVDKRADK